MQRTGGMRRKTRNKLKKNVSDKGKISIRKFFQSFKEGEKIVLKAEPGIQKGMYHPRFHGKVGIVMGKIGNCYDVQIKDGKKKKSFRVHPVHLKRLS